MKGAATVFFVVFALSGAAAMAGESVSICRDEAGNAYFTDTSCLNNLASEVTVYVPNAQGYSRRFSAGEVQMLIDRDQRIRESRFNAVAPVPATGPSYSDRIAARNAAMSAKNSRDMYRHRKTGPRDAAEFAIEYNAESVANGGNHQVRVPDVTNVHNHYENTGGHRHREYNYQR